MQTRVTLSLSLLSCLAGFLPVGLVTAQSQPVAATFRTTNQVGARISVGGTNLLVDDAGVGGYLIGSDDGTDDANNVASFVAGNNGSLRPMNGAPTPTLPYSLVFRPDPVDPSILRFDVSVGPSAFNFTSVSLPLDGRLQQFFYWRYAGQNGLGRYDQNPLAYTPPGGGPVYIRFAPGSPAWGEMIGPDYTVRVRVTSSSRPLTLAFVNAPSLSSGVRNVEFSFGRVAVGQSASASGLIRVFRTDPALFAMAPLTYQCEGHSFHQIGRADLDGWSVRVGDQPGRFPNYGPYVTTLIPGNRVATYRLMLDNTTADNNLILTLDVFDSATNRILATRGLRRSMFTAGPFHYQDFTLTFTASAGQRLEFRTYWHGGSYVRQDYVRVQ